MTPELARYHRQILLPGFGEEGQKKLLGSTALVLGCGALGSLIVDLRARAGVGRLVSVDRDLVELTNLQRQVLFDERDVADAMPKAEAARRRIARVNSQIDVVPIVDDLNHRNIERHAAGADVLVDGVDNFETRYLANDFAVKHGIPYIYGGAVGAVGAAFAILPHTASKNAAWETRPRDSRATPCLRCLFDEVPAGAATCDTVGVLAPAVATIASFEVAETLKVLTRNFDRVCPTMLNVDLWNNTIVQLKVDRAYDDGDCPCCKHGQFEYLEGTRGSGTTTLCGRNAVQLTHAQDAAVDLALIAERLRRHGKVVAGDFMLRADITDNGRPYSLSVFPNGRAIIHGTAEASIARSLYAKYVGN